MRTRKEKKNDQASQTGDDGGGTDPQQALTGTTRRSLIRNAVLFAMFSASGVSLTGCGGGGGGGGGGIGGGIGGGGGSPPVCRARDPRDIVDLVHLCDAHSLHRERHSRRS